MPTAPLEGDDNATRLRRRAKRRRTRGGWLLAIVLVLAVIAGGTGWWFGSGPGSLAGVPDVSGRSYDDAAFLLEQASLVPVEAPAFSLDVEQGLAVGTDPAAGNLLDRGTEVTVYISQGPQPQTIEPLVGKSEETAVGIIEAKKLIVRDDPLVVFNDQPAGNVAAVRLYTTTNPDSPGNCDEGCEAHEGDTIRLIVSAGPFPDVVGKPVDQAIAELGAVNLNVADDRPEEFNNDIPAGSVIRVGDREGGGSWRPGDTVTLVVSQGPAPIEVPDVVGRTVADAMSILRDAGFEPGTALPELVWGIFTVSSTDPPGGEFRVPGTPIVVRATG
jgi:eukaryotic-like serine/threonine-protein kinase